MHARLFTSGDGVAWREALRYERLSSEAWASALVEDRSVKSAFVGFGFSF